MGFFNFWGYEHLEPTDVVTTAFLGQVSGATIVGDLLTTWRTRQPQHMFVSSELNRGRIEVRRMADGYVYLRHNYNNGGSTMGAGATFAEFLFTIYHPTNNIYQSTDQDIISFGIRLDRTGTAPANWRDNQAMVTIGPATGTNIDWSAEGVPFRTAGYLEVEIDRSTNHVRVWLDNMLVDEYDSFNPAVQRVSIMGAPISGSSATYCVTAIGPHYLKVANKNEEHAGRCGPIGIRLVPLDTVEGEWGVGITEQQVLSTLNTLITPANLSQTISTNDRDKPMKLSGNPAVDSDTLGISSVVISSRDVTANVDIEQNISSGGVTDTKTTLLTGVGFQHSSVTTQHTGLDSSVSIRSVRKE